MKSRVYSTFWISILFYFSFPSAVKAQILNDADTKEQVIHALKHIYNFEFKEAEPYQQRIRSKYPAHPVNPLLEAIQTFWQYLPVVENGSAASRYQGYLNQSLQQAEKLKAANKHDTEATFFLLATHSYLAMLESDRGEFMKAGAEAKRTYSYMRKGFKLMEQNPEFYFSTGLYNYYREQYPQDHPVVKPIMFFFQDGNKNLGLKQMETGYQKGIFTKTEAAYYLTYVLIKHENNPLKALSYSTSLYKEYSENPVYTTRHAEALTLSGRYGDAEPLAQQLAQKKHYVFKTAGEVFIGLILEKGKKNDAAANAYYQKAVLNKMSEQYTQDYHAMAYCGMARIAERNGQAKQAKDYYQKAQKLAEYSSTLQEIKRALK